MRLVRISSSSFAITSAVFVVFILDMASPGYGSFLLIPDLRPQIATLTTDIRSDLENLTRSKSSPIAPQKTPQPDKTRNCQTLLDGYKPNAQCHFEQTNFFSGD